MELKANTREYDQYRKAYNTGALFEIEGFTLISKNEQFQSTAVNQISKDKDHQPTDDEIKEHKKLDNILKVTVDFVAEVITCIKDKDKKIISGDPEKIKKIYDTWVFSRDTTSQNPNWQLVNILT